MKKVDYQELCDSVVPPIEYTDDTTVVELKQLLADFKNPEPKPVVAPVEVRYTADITIDMIITTSNGIPHERNIIIKNPNGCMGTNRSTDPDYVISTLKEELVNRFGSNHVA